MADDIDVDLDMGLNVEGEYEGEDEYATLDPNDDSILNPTDETEDVETRAPTGDKDEIKADITADDDAEADVNEATQEITCSSLTARADAAQKNKAICPNPIRITLPRMTKYEKARLLGQRAKMIEEGSPPFVDLLGETNPIKIAYMELLAKRLPLIVRRPLPDGSCEDWKASELAL
jgi:DNA-directed RNA polymerase subunit K/omega